MPNFGEIIIIRGGLIYFEGSFRVTGRGSDYLAVEKDLPIRLSQMTSNSTYDSRLNCPGS